MKCEALILEVRWGGSWWGYRWNQSSLGLIIVETGQMVYGASLVFSPLLYVSKFPNKRVEMKMLLSACGLEGVFAQLQTWKRVEQHLQLLQPLLAMVLLPPLPDSTHFVIPEYPTAPLSEDPRNCSSPDPKSAEAPDSWVPSLAPWQ